MTRHATPQDLADYARATSSGPHAPLLCRHCGDSFDTERPCPSPDAGKRPLIDSGIGGHRFYPPDPPSPPEPMSRKRLQEIRALAVDAINEPTGMRPPYGDTSGRVGVDMMRAMVDNMKEEPLSQSNMNDLVAELSMACDEIDLLRKVVATVPELLAEYDRLQVECKRLRRVGLESARIGGEPAFTREQIDRITADEPGGEVRR